MGKLFWKFFLMFWLAQLVTMIGVGIAVDFIHGQRLREMRAAGLEQPREHGDFRLPPGAFERPGPADERERDRPQSDFTPPPESSAAAWAPRSSKSVATERPERLSRFNPEAVRIIEPHGGFSPRLLILPIEPLLAGFIVSLIFAAALAWRFSRPIRSLREAFATLASGKLDVRLSDSLGRSNDEFGELGRSFDGMASQLGDLVGAQRRLLHDVSHELRSPLARLQAATGLARQQPDKLEASMARIEREAQRMDLLIDELLTLSRLETDSSINLTEEINLSELLDGIVEDACFEATEGGITVRLRGNTSLQLRCQPAMLHRAVENLVRNAIKFSVPDSTVTLIVDRPNQDDLMLRVEDEGPGISPEELDSVFQPFVRGRSTRAVTGYGLGLAIARRVVEAHGGQISAENRPEGGLRVNIRLPANLIMAPTH